MLQELDDLQVQQKKTSEALSARVKMLDAKSKERKENKDQDIGRVLSPRPASNQTDSRPRPPPKPKSLSLQAEPAPPSPPVRMRPAPPPRVPKDKSEDKEAPPAKVTEQDDYVPRIRTLSNSKQTIRHRRSRSFSSIRFRKHGGIDSYQDSSDEDPQVQDTYSKEERMPSPRRSTQPAIVSAGSQELSHMKRHQENTLQQHAAQQVQSKRDLLRPAPLRIAPVAPNSAHFFQQQVSHPPPPSSEYRRLTHEELAERINHERLDARFSTFGVGLANGVRGSIYQLQKESARGRSATFNVGEANVSPRIPLSSTFGPPLDSLIPVAQHPHQTTPNLTIKTDRRHTWKAPVRTLVTEPTEPTAPMQSHKVTKVQKDGSPDSQRTIYWTQTLEDPTTLSSPVPSFQMAATTSHMERQPSHLTKSKSQPLTSTSRLKTVTFKPEPYTPITTASAYSSSPTSNYTSSSTPATSTTPPVVLVGDKVIRKSSISGQLPLPLHTTLSTTMNSPERHHSQHSTHTLESNRTTTSSVQSGVSEQYTHTLKKLRAGRTGKGIKLMDWCVICKEPIFLLESRWSCSGYL
jgi:hypothetical protein